MFEKAPEARRLPEARSVEPAGVGGGASHDAAPPVVTTLGGLVGIRMLVDEPPRGPGPSHLPILANRCREQLTQRWQLCYDEDFSMLEENVLVFFSRSLFEI